MSYLGNLTMRLAGGAMRFSEEFRARHERFFRAAQTDDGGFAGRRGSGDLYYTGFALRGLALLGALNGPTARRAADFLRARLDRPAPIVDFLSLVYGAVLLEVMAEIDVFAEAGLDRGRAIAEAVAPYRCEDGGYAKTPGNRHSSTYYTLLVHLSRELAGEPPQDPETTASLIRSRRRDDGGFVELAPLRRGGANPTAAAVSLLRMLDALDKSTGAGAARFLARMQNVEGGFRANSVIPAADLLSTFTALVTLSDLGKLDQVDAPAARAYAESLEQPDGGFRGGIWDDVADVEYTFYGIGTMALLETMG